MGHDIKNFNHALNAKLADLETEKSKREAKEQELEVERAEAKTKTEEADRMMDALRAEKVEEVEKMLRKIETQSKTLQSTRQEISEMSTRFMEQDSAQKLELSSLQKQLANREEAMT